VRLISGRRLSSQPRQQGEVCQRIQRADLGGPCSCIMHLGRKRGSVVFSILHSARMNSIKKNSYCCKRRRIQKEAYFVVDTPDMGKSEW
jgi:hypothetical protein